MRKIVTILRMLSIRPTQVYSYIFLIFIRVDKTIFNNILPLIMSELGSRARYFTDLVIKSRQVANLGYFVQKNKYVLTKYLFSVFTVGSRAESVASGRGQAWADNSGPRPNDQMSTFDFLVKSSYTTSFLLQSNGCGSQLASLMAICGRDDSDISSILYYRQ